MDGWPWICKIARDMSLSRRSFLDRLTACLLAGPWMLQPSILAARSRELQADLVIVGGGVGGCAAALAACRNGLRVILTEATDWLGGQLTAQAVPPDEHPWIEHFGCTRSYREFREGVRSFYRAHYPLTPEARAQPFLNPGNGWVSRLCHEPRVALAVLHQMLAPHCSGGRLTVLGEHAPVNAAISGDRVVVVEVEDRRSGDRRTLRAPFFIDATELGELLPLTGTEHVVGAEARRDTGEPHAPPEPDPGDQQAFTWCFVVEYLPGEDHTIERPEEYDFWRTYVPRLQPPWPGPLLSWEASDPRTLGVRRFVFDPTLRSSGLNLWTYRRIAAAAQFVPGTYRSDLCLVNWPQNDYWLGPLVGVSPAEAARNLARAKQLSLSLLYWMQTEAPRPDGGTGWKGLRLRPDVVGTSDGLAKAPYIRESRRLLAEFTVTEQHVGTEARMALTGKPRDEILAERFADTVGVGAYRIDLHPRTNGRNYLDLSCLPFQIPLGALLPRRVENLLAGAKNIGTTHITNGAYRLHPVEWTVGEAAGVLVAFCHSKKAVPRQVRNNPKLLAEFQQTLQRQGFELEWPRLRPL
jgi:hypothetical protein